ncbi:MAG: S8 family peptidase [Clostridiales bacterium]|nr:S8 family peptidase [Clostridiales bacterium]
MALNIDDELNLPLSEFVKLPTTVDFQVLNTERFKIFAKSRPYIRLGTEFENRYIVGYINQAYVSQLVNDLGGDFLYFLPRIMSPTDSQSNDASGITRVLNQPFLNLSGRGVIIGIVDTGIDYRKDAFKFEDGSTKILGIWDQTVDGKRQDDLYFGSTYTSDDINNANRSSDPYSIVPSVDEDGHGTFLASVAASNEPGEYIGAAPKAYLLIVKLKKACQYLIDRYLVTNDNPNLYESTDYMLGMKYILDASEKFNMPIVMCIGMGTNDGAHDGSTLIEEYISFVSQRVGYAFVTAVGNEANAKHHTQGKIPATRAADRISIKVGEQGASFTVIIHSPGYDKISAGVTSPTGEAVPRVSFQSGLEYSNQLVLENTRITLRYFRDNNNNVIVSFKNATQGIWNIILYGDLIINGEYWAWLPITGQISPTVEFLRPTPEYTTVIPSTALRAIKCGAYNSKDQSLLVSSSWGPTRLFRIAPDFVAPGVDVKGIYPTGYGTMTGTSVAAAITAGITALLFEWGIVNGNKTAMDSDLIRSYLISGCQRESNLAYPNIQWGFGKVNLYGTFEVIKESALDFNTMIEEGDFSQ